MLKHVFFLLLALSFFPALAAAESPIANADDLGDIKALKDVVKETPDDYQTWFVLGVTQARNRLFDDAIGSFHQVIELKPKLAEPHNNLAVIYNEKGDLRAAINELEASLLLNPGYVTAHENIGDLYVKLAAESYKKALLGNDNADLAQRYTRLLQIRHADVAASFTSQQVQSELGISAKETAAKETAATNTELPVAMSKRQEVLAAIEVWRKAWSKQDVAAYFAAYDESFDPGVRFKTRKSWQHYKKSMIRNKKYIKVELGNIVLSEQNNGNIKVVMMQHFRSNSYQSDDLKTVVLRSTDAGWKIIHEAIL